MWNKERLEHGSHSWYYNLLAVASNLAVAKLEPNKGRGGACGGCSHQSGDARDVAKLKWAIAGDDRVVYGRKTHGVQVDTAKP